jgi:biotin-dependent carboxylase-like uncharacterized protein
MTAALEVLATGPLALFTDAGRPGLAHLGVSRSGAADRAGYALSGRLVGNPPGGTAIEITLGGLVLRARRPLMLALTGADCPAWADGRRMPDQGPFYLAAGQTLALDRPAAGFRSYLAVRGGFAVTPELGSAATDTLSGLGPAPLAAGDLLNVGGSPDTPFPGVDQVGRAAAVAGPVVLQARLGPRADWLADPGDLSAPEWVVSPASDRVGVRLTGGTLPRSPATLGRELPSEGVVRGGIQVPSNGEPVIFGPDHPVTGGYPVVAVLTAASSDALAQVRPGERVRVRLIR